MRTSSRFDLLVRIDVDGAELAVGNRSVGVSECRSVGVSEGQGMPDGESATTRLPSWWLKSRDHLIVSYYY